MSRVRAVASLLVRTVALGAAASVLLAATHASAEPKPTPAKPADDDAGLEEEPMPPPGYLPGHQKEVGLGLSPHAPNQPSILPSGIMPVFGAPVRPAEGGRFDFHGYVQAGGRASFNSRLATPEHGSYSIHGDPVVPRGNVFENTNNVPYTWSELRFQYSTPTLTSTVSLGAWALSESMNAAGSYMPQAQLWVRDAFLSYTPRGLDPVQLNVKVGAYEDRYGWMEQYSAGAYGAPLIASIHGVGETISAKVPIGSDFSLQLEQGIKGDVVRTPPDISTRADNNWAKPWEGQTLVNHLHLGFDWKSTINPAFHYIQAFSRDDQSDNVPLGNLRAGYQEWKGGVPPSYPELDHADGSLRVIAGDVRFALRRFGYLYLGVSSTTVEGVRSVSDIVQVLNAGGGRDLMDRYFGRNNNPGKGSLLLAGGEYQVSLGEVLRYPEEYWGEGPDLKLSVFGMVSHVTSEDPARDTQDQYKFGVEGTYSILSWLATSGRIDHAVPYMHGPPTRDYPSKPQDPLCLPTAPSGSYSPAGGGPYRCFLYKEQNDNTFSVLTGKLILRSDWTARETLTFQYSRYIYRSDFHLVTLNSGGQVSNQTDHPDQDLVAVYGTLWW
ncbi:MAG TPA: hypothetical protein VNN72_17470 [Polyangiaceae bacterium]|nr:hypothetical protein [Polyangiaceae bacterium]